MNFFIPEKQINMIKIEEVYKIIGQINLTLSRINFIVSDHLHKMGLEAESGAFFSDPNATSKFEKLPSRYTEFMLSPKVKTDLEQWVSEFISYVRERNTITHSLVLFSIDNPDEFRFYNYRKSKGNVSMEVTEFSLEKLDSFNKKFIEIHNVGCNVLLEIENSIQLVSLLKVYNPHDSLKEIEPWLIEENKESNTGFYSQIELIRHRFYAQKAYLALVDGEIVGFATYTVFENIATIELLEIKPDKRQMGYGTSFVRKLKLNFKKDGCNAIAIKSIDKASDTFWEKTGFKNIVELKIRGPGFTHFLSLTKSEYQTEVNKKKQVQVSVKIYDTISINANYEIPVYSWHYSSEQKMLVQPVDFEWTIKVYKDDNEIYCNLIKRLDNEKCRVLFGSFLVITDITEVLRYIKRIT
jgi:GNAT superfamily N-acetyltransferase